MIYVTDRVLCIVKCMHVLLDISVLGLIVADLVDESHQADYCADTVLGDLV